MSTDNNSKTSSQTDGGKHSSTSETSRHRKCQFRADKRWLDLQFHEGTKEKVVRPHELRDQLKEPPREELDESITNRIWGSIVGLALGDAVGAHVEFRPRDFLIEHPVTEMKAGGTWGLEIGQFTDDTSMALCLACSLIARRDFVPYDQLVRCNWWKRYGYLSSTGECFDIGKATKTALDTFTSRQHDFASDHAIPIKDLDYLSDEKLLDEFPVNCGEDDAAGNGSLMRLAPVPLFFYKDPIIAVEYSGLSSRITHNDPKAVDACRYYGALIVAALHGETKDQLLSKKFYQEHKEWFGKESLHTSIMEIAKGSYQKSKAKPNPKEIQGKGYVVNALEAALWAFWSDDDSFEKGVLLAVNLGDDTDTTAAIYGQLAGAYYGRDKLPGKWLEKIYAKGFLRCISDWIRYEGARWKAEEDEPASSKDVASGKTEAKQRKESTNSRARLSISNGMNFKVSIPEGPEDPLKSARSRRPSLYDINPVGLATRRLTVQNTHRSKSKETDHGRTRIYIHKELKTCGDVCQRLLKKLSDKNQEQLKDFYKFDVDAYWLLNMVDTQNLEKYGIKDAKLRETIVKEIGKLRAECPTKYATEN